MANDTAPLDGAELLATLGDTHYYRVAWIVAQTDDGPLAYYATVCGWPETPVGQLVTRDTEIARLRARLADLEQQLAAHTVPAAVASAASGMRGASVDDDPAHGIHRCPCPVCGKKIWPSQVARHMADAHADVPSASSTEPAELAAESADRVPRPHAPYVQQAPAEPPPVQFDGWRCRACGADVYAAATTDPSLCIRCVKQRQQVVA